MDEPVDLTKCQPGDLLRLRDGSEAIYIGDSLNDTYPHLIRSDEWGESSVCGNGASYDNGLECVADVVAIVHPTRAEIEEQRRELLEACKAMIIAFPGVSVMPTHEARAENAAREQARKAIASAEATHE